MSHFMSHMIWVIKKVRGSDSVGHIGSKNIVRRSTTWLGIFTLRTLVIKYDVIKTYDFLFASKVFGSNLHFLACKLQLHPEKCYDNPLPVVFWVTSGRLPVYLRTHSLGFSLVPLCQGLSWKNGMHLLHVSPSVPCLQLQTGFPSRIVQLNLRWVIWMINMNESFVWVIWMSHMNESYLSAWPLHWQLPPILISEMEYWKASISAALWFFLSPAADGQSDGRINSILIAPAVFQC